MRRRADGDKISRGSTIISCPHRISLSASNAFAHITAISAVTQDSRYADTDSAETIFKTAPRPQCLAALLLCVLSGRGRHNFWEPYIDLLPKPDDLEPEPIQSGPGLPLWWRGEEKSWVDGSPLAKGFRDLEALWRTEYDQWRPHFDGWADEVSLDCSW